MTVESLPRSCPARDLILSSSSPLDTLALLWGHAVGLGGNRACLGSREVLEEEEEEQENGKKMTKLTMGDYK